MSTVATIGIPILQAGEQRRTIRAQAREQRRINQTQRAQASIQNARIRRQAVAQARIQRAQLEQQAQASGVAGSTGAIGAGFAAQSTLAGNIGFANTQLASAGAIQTFQQNIADEQARTARRQALFQSASTINQQLQRLPGFFGG